MIDIEKQVLTVEWLPSYNKYRVWNSDYEDWYDDRKTLIDVCKEVQGQFIFTTYGTHDLIVDFETNGLYLIGVHND